MYSSVKDIQCSCHIQCSVINHWVTVSVIDIDTCGDTYLLHVKLEMSSLYDMYIVHVLPVKEKKKFYKEDNFSTWESFLYFVLCPEYLPLYVKIDIDTCGDMNVLYIFCFFISLKLLLYLEC
jgi:hypothetical protein